MELLIRGPLYFGSQLRAIHPLPFIILLCNLQHRELGRHNPARCRPRDNRVFGKVGHAAFFPKEVFVGIQEPVDFAWRGSDHLYNGIGEDCLVKCE